MIFIIYGDGIMFNNSLYINRISNLAWEYINLISRIIANPKQTIVDICNDKFAFSINHRAFFMINIAIMQFLCFCYTVISNNSIVTCEFYFELPVIGKVHAYYVLNFIGIILGHIVISAIISHFTFIEKQVVEKVVFYFSIYWIVLSFLGKILVAMITYILVSSNIMYDRFYSSIDVTSLSNIENLFKQVEIAMVIGSVLACILYLLGLLTILVGVVGKDRIKLKKIVAIFLIVFSVGTGLDIFKFELTKSVVKSIKNEMMRVQQLELGITLQAIEVHDNGKIEAITLQKNDNLDEIQEELFETYRRLYDIKALLAEDRVQLYEQYYLMSNVDKITELCNEDKSTVMSKIISYNPKKDKYIDLLASNRVDLKTAAELQKVKKYATDEEEKYKEFSPRSIFISKVAGFVKDSVIWIYFLPDLFIVFP